MKFKHIVPALMGVVFIMSALTIIADQQKETRKSRAGIVVIDSMKGFGVLERSGVLFPHDKHTDALEKQGKDCDTCHLTDGDKLSLKFKRTQETDRDSTLDIYHNGCISCHEENAKLEIQTGPVECGTCHQAEPVVVSVQPVVHFDASLHQRHIEAADNTCESCHHGYNAEKKEIVYVKGAEESCRTCHKDQAQGDVISYRAATHQQCISCHQKDEKEKKKIENKAVAAAKCAGCHDQELLQQIVRLDTIPRLDRNQPDITFIKSLDDMTRPLLDAVVFNHKQHEERGLTCSTCHHETLNACESCHTLSGSKEGQGVTLAQAMHKAGSDRSCIGCHNKEQQATACVGCHSLMPDTVHGVKGQSCQTCHSVSMAMLREHKASGKKLLAKDYLPAPVPETRVDIQALPEEVLIGRISEQYEAVHFPHRDIVAALMDNLKGSNLATSFHQGKDLVCQSCHHNSPDVTNPPPSCNSCHSSSTDAGDGHIPEIKAAYHRQCFECHAAMEIKNPVSTDCVACHEEKK
ncbi:hypothetical protein KKI24_15945 [bacterium]|nr:hypothetical protein [bacterium]